MKKSGPGSQILTSPSRTCTRYSLKDKFANVGKPNNVYVDFNDYVAQLLIGK